MVDREPRIESLERDIDKELRRACDPAHRNYFRELLEGWWFVQCIDQMQDSLSPGILLASVDGYIDELRGQFARDNLPVELFQRANDQLLSSHEGSVFLSQLRYIGITDNPSLTRAVWDYVRAYGQRSKWEREGLVTTEELPAYEGRLVDEWDGHFIVMCRELGSEAGAEAMEAAGRALYKWVETEADIRVREQVTHRWLTRGSYQMLANETRVGWHPEFKQLYGAPDEQASA